MISARKLIKLARKWQKLAAIRRKRITFSSTSSMVEKGHFVVYSADEKRFMLPLEYLKNEMVMELFNLAEEEFGIPSDGHLILPFDSTFMEYAIGLIKRKASKEVEKALTVSIVNGRCSSSSNLYQQETSQQLPIWMVVKGCFVIFTTDKRHFVIPLAFLSNCIFRELFKMSEEEFVLPSDGPITLPCDSVFMNYIISIVKRGLSKDLERAVVNSISTYCFSSDTNFNQGHEDTQSLVFGF
ncbi:hypothetical protein ERO13_D02G228533v2 [Gossypium hirsutum]|uniref:Auxin-responsive protein n=1 Tax=Gossypium mustelinum TaxID=34275 RepID=A0A5D2W0P0_GOSMU|nr:hypothetical protein ERO13_D02G228533v2 [Gossypium hirsutum]TYI95281.1 hypothetical protein E1A91_D02G268500v1 [Gossypium mustelinum]